MRAPARWPSGMLIDVDAVDLQPPRALDDLLGLVAARRQQLDGDDERAARHRVGQPRLVLARDRRPLDAARRRRSHGGRARPRPSCDRTTAGAIARTAALIWRMCSGVVPQQPPTIRTLCMMKRRA